VYLCSHHLFNISVGLVNVQELTLGTFAETDAGPHVTRSGSLCETATSSKSVQWF